MKKEEEEEVVIGGKGGGAMKTECRRKLEKAKGNGENLQQDPGYIGQGLKLLIKLNA
jgi:hypothetical protein